MPHRLEPRPLAAWTRAINRGLLASRGIAVAAAVPLAATVPWPAAAADPDETPIAFCTATTTDEGGRGGCVCAVEGVEVTLALPDYRRAIAAWRGAAMLTGAELGALERDRAAACSGDGSDGGAHPVANVR